MRTLSPDDMFEIIRTVPLSQIKLEERYEREMENMWNFIVSRESLDAIRDFDGHAQWMGWYGGHIRGTFTARWNDVRKDIYAKGTLIDASALLPTNLTMGRVQYYNDDAPRLWASRFHVMSFIKSGGGDAAKLSTGLQWGALAAQPILVVDDESHENHWRNQRGFADAWRETKGRKIVLEIGSRMNAEIVCL